jgi:hypothetical protein
MRGLVLVSAVALLASACSSGPTSAFHASPSGEAASVSPQPKETIVSSGCGATSVVRGGVPAWVDVAGAHNNPDGLPYVLAIPSGAAGFIFGYPLRAGHPQSPTNKILWVVGLPRNGSPLEVSGHPLNATTPSIHETQPADSGPGEIYPSVIDVPKPGCWHFDLSWAGNHATVELEYQ